MARHEHYERMAVGHVLGGLDQVDAAAFRAHLLACADCRRRVNELRDIASDLARTEREERRAAARAGDVEVETRTDQAHQAAPQATEGAPPRQWPWGVVVIGLVPLLVLGTLAWAVWQRAQSDLSAAVVESQQQVLDVLASGEPVEWTSAGAVEGNIATDGEFVALNLVGLPEFGADRGLVVWLLGRDGEAVAHTTPYLPPQVDDTLVAILQHPADAARVVVSVETDLPDLSFTRPEGHRLVTGELPAVATGSE